MTRVLLVRHGTTDHLGRILSGRMPGVSLNAQGRDEAKALADLLKRRFKVDLVVSSPLERAQETANVIATALGSKIELESGFIELDLGIWTGKTFAELSQREDWKLYNGLRSAVAAPGGESLVDVQARAIRTLKTVVARYTHKTLVLVSHGDVIRSLIMLVLGMALDQLHRLEISPASYSELQVCDDALVIFNVNQTAG